MKLVWRESAHHQIHLVLGKFDAKYSGESGASVCVNPLGVQSIYFFSHINFTHV